MLTNARSAETKIDGELTSVQRNQRIANMQRVDGSAKRETLSKRVNLFKNNFLPSALFGSVMIDS